MDVKFTSPERTLFIATKKFHLDNGDTEQVANEKAMNKIIAVRMLKTQVAKH